MAFKAVNYEYIPAEKSKFVIDLYSVGSLISFRHNFSDKKITPYAEIGFIANYLIFGKEIVKQIYSPYPLIGNLSEKIDYDDYNLISFGAKIGMGISINNKTLLGVNLKYTMQDHIEWAKDEGIGTFSILVSINKLFAI